LEVCRGRSKLAAADERDPAGRRLLRAQPEVAQRADHWGTEISSRAGMGRISASSRCAGGSATVPPKLPACFLTREFVEGDVLYQPWRRSLLLRLCGYVRSG
jgi:hypothetical protein